jgi:hypothetical protein
MVHLLRLQWINFAGKGKAKRKEKRNEYKGSLTDLLIREIQQDRHGAKQTAGYGTQAASTTAFLFNARAHILSSFIVDHTNSFLFFDHHKLYPSALVLYYFA